MDFSKSNHFESEKGTIGNLLTIIAIRRNRQMHTTFNGKVISPESRDYINDICSIYSKLVSDRFANSIDNAAIECYFICSWEFGSQL